MEDLIGTVRQRYGRWPGFCNLSTLQYRTRLRFNAAPEQSGIEAAGRSLLWALSRDVTRKVEQWQLQSAHTEQRLREAAKRQQRRTELLFEGTGGQLRYLRKQTKRLMEREEEREEDMARKPKTELPLTYRAAERLMEERIVRVETALQVEIQAREKKSEREILRRIREDEYFEKRRRGW